MSIESLIFLFLLLFLLGGACSFALGGYPGVLVYCLTFLVTGAPALLR